MDSKTKKNLKPLPHHKFSNQNCALDVIMLGSEVGVSVLVDLLNNRPTLHVWWLKAPTVYLFAPDSTRCAALGGADMSEAERS